MYSNNTQTKEVKQQTKLLYIMYSNITQAFCHQFIGYKTNNYSANGKTIIYGINNQAGVISQSDAYRTIDE